MPQIKVRDKFDNPLKLINIRLAFGNQSSDEAYDDKFTDYAGNTAWPNPLPSTHGYSLFVNYANVNFDYKPIQLTVPNLNSDINITLEHTALARIFGTDYYFSKFIKGESAFLDYYRFLRGEDITPLLKRSMELGSNCRRNFLMTRNTGIAGGLGVCNPDDFGEDFFTKFPDFLGKYEQCGVYGYFSVFPDNKVISNWSDVNKQKTFWNRIGEIAQAYPTVFALELTNEIYAHPELNGVDITQFNRIPGVMCCSGSVGDSGGVVVPMQWDFVDYHQPRNYPTVVNDANVCNHPNRLQMHQRVGCGEPIGFGNKAVNPNREDNPRIAKEIAGTGKGTECHTIFHSSHGAFSQPYDDIENACAEAWFGELK